MYKSIASLVALLLAAGIALAEQAPLTVYRDAGGQLTPESRQAAREMHYIAVGNGHITLWLTLNYEFNLYLDPETQQREIEQQNQEVRAGFEEILNPMVARGAVWHPKAGPYYRGPGCFIRANAAGLQRLVQDERILQIVGVEQRRN
jgi:hypothetical protein